ncbi:MAG: hypothetical protein Q8L87_14800 [Anaerolineales bacterium]|nr:hypothetical protein [Anaerolineales bacterium]
MPNENPKIRDQRIRLDEAVKIRRFIAQRTSEAHQFHGKTGITTLRGKWLEINTYWVMPIFHPSYLLRNQSREPGSPKSLMWEDIREVRRKYDELLAR